MIPSFELALALGFAITLAGLLGLRRIAPQWGLIDYPSERKQHKTATPLIGGLAIFLGLTVSLMWWLPLNPLVSSFLVAGGVLVFVGLLDDIYDVSIRIRLLGQTLAACVVLSGDTYLLSLGNLLGTGALQLDWLAWPFTLFALVGMTNAFNMLDGIDGLLGMCSLTAAIAFAFLALMAGNALLAFIATVLVCILVPFLVMNLLPSSSAYKVFMGDAGSLLMGFVFAWLMVVGSQPHLSMPPVIEPVTALFLLALPLVDIVTVLLRRIKQQRNPFMADRQHIHHLFSKAGYSQHQALVYLTLIMGAFAGVGVLLQCLATPELFRLAAFAFLTLAYMLLTKRLKIKMARNEQA